MWNAQLKHITGGEKKVGKRRENFGKMSRIGLGDRTLLTDFDLSHPSSTKLTHNNITTSLQMNTSTGQPRTIIQIPCCLCGTLINPNPANQCGACLAQMVDLKVRIEQ